MNLFNVNNILRKVDLIGVVGTASLVMKTASNKFQLSHGKSYSNSYFLVKFSSFKICVS